MSIARAFLLCFLITCTLASNCKIVDSSDHLVGYRISNGVLNTLNTIGIVGCQRECVKITRCRSIGYNKATLECSLGQYDDNKTFTGVPTDIVIRPDLTDSIFESLGNCKNRPCAPYESCVQLSSGNFACIKNYRPLDLAIIIDGSRSLDSSAFNAVLDTIKYLVTALFDMRLAVAYFNVNTHIPIYFDQFLNKSDMLTGVDTVVYPDNVGNELGQALLDVYNGVFDQARGDRTNAMDVIVVFLDPDDMNQVNLNTNANNIKSANIHVITVGISGTEVGLAVMHQVASAPLEKNVLEVDVYSNLAAVYETIVDMINAIP